MTIFAGLWDVTLDTPIGKMAVVLDITDHDGAITGTASTDKETVEFIDAVADRKPLDLDTESHDANETHAEVRSCR
jgi:hypothetical protein